METLPVKTLDELFSNPATCLAVFRFPPCPPPHLLYLLHLLTSRTPCCSSSHCVSLRSQIFRSLPELAKMFIFRLLYIDTNKMEIPVALITTSWCLPTAKE